MTGRIAIFPLITSAWTGAIRALVPALPWLILFAVTAGLYSFALRSGAGLWPPLGTALLAFLAGNEMSRRTYKALMPDAPAKFLPLAHANIAVYGAFLFIGFFVVFFLMMLPGILIEEAGQYQLDKDSDPALAREALGALLATPYGTVFLICCLAGAGVLGWFALRLTLYGAATSARGNAQVFRTWGLTKGQLKALVPVSLATHVIPFGLGIVLNGALHGALPDTAMGHFLGGAAGVLLFAPFLLAGHAMAVGAWEKLKPADVPLTPPISGD